MRLDALREGHSAVVTMVETAETMRKRLSDFGLIEGTKICCIRRNRTACVLYVRGTMLALRRTDMAKIGVRLCD